uniref:G-protein coupled receptors family 1 profile domain-containing protein n=1 Tax=Knipowitschia caucasica TaxID=637954 RepID=A0AAV2MAU3_KNICA
MNDTALNQTDCPEVKVPVPLFFIIGVVSLAENLLVVIAVISNRNLHSPMYCFICSLAAFNTIASVTKSWENLMILLADVGQLQRTGVSETSLDDLMDSLLCMSFMGSIFSFLAIAVDRYM